MDSAFTNSVDKVTYSLETYPSPSSILPSEEGNIVGKLYNKSVGNFIEEENGWYKIKSGTFLDINLDPAVQLFCDDQLILDGHQTEHCLFQAGLFTYFKGGRRNRCDGRCQ